VTCFAIQQTDTVQPAGVDGTGSSLSATPSGYGPSTLAAAYKLDQTKGGEQVVAIVDAYDNPNAAADLATYRAQYGLPPCTTANGCFRKVNQSGTTTNLPPSNVGWAGEIALDLDMVSATCPKCHILLVEATNSSFTNMGIAVNRAVTMGARYVSNSYGGDEFGSLVNFDTSYFRHPGVAITASAGDKNYGASYPATSAYVTAVGGTRLTSANNARGWTETVWNNSANQGTGSGCSAYVGKPAFQANVTTGCGNRAEADVSAVSDPNTGVAVYNTYQAAGWAVYGGTSAAAPIVASVYALAGTSGASDSANAYPYSHASSLFDVTSGNNGTSCSTAVLCTAGTGWDGPTGLGTPNGSGAFASRNTVSITNPGTQTSAAGRSLSLQIRAGHSASGSTLSYTASGLPPGLAISPATGLISGTPSALARYTVTATATDETAVSSSTTFTWRVQAPGTLVTVTPARVLDTRSGNGAAKAPVAAGADLVLPIAGRGGVPSAGMSAVVVNVTVTQPTTAGYISAWADGTSMPVVSNVNFTSDQTVPNLAIVPVGANGAIRLHNGSGGTVQLIADVSGYYLAGTPSAPGSLSTVTPARVLDTRTGNGAARARVAAGTDQVVRVTGQGGVPGTGVSAVVVNLTVTEPTTAGFISAWADGGSTPVVSNLNFTANQTVPNLAIVPVGETGAIRLHNGSNGTVQLIADISGYFLAGTPAVSGTLATVSPTRVLDTRTGDGAVKVAVAAGADLVVQIGGSGAVPVGGVSAVVLNVTVTLPMASGYVSAWADGSPMPAVSNLNFTKSQTVPNLAIVPVSANGAIRLHNGSTGTVHLVADVSGYHLS
jgi:hypothetical protein